MTLDFIEKRIKEQIDYLFEITMIYDCGEIDLFRAFKISESAKSQLEYFESEKQKLIANETR